MLIEDSAEGDLLKLLSCLGVAPLHITTLRSGRAVFSERLSALLRDEENVRSALTSLQSRKCLTTDGSVVIVPEPVRRATREVMGTDAKRYWILRAVKFVAEVFPTEKFYDYAIPACDVLVPHGVAATDFAVAEEIAEEEAGTLLNQLGLYLYGGGDAVAAERCYRHSIHLGLKVLGEKSDTVGIRWNNLGATYMALSKLGRAKDCFENAVEILTAAKGHSHESLALPLSNLYKAQMDMEDWEGARKACGNAMELYMEIYAYYHPLVAECANSLGIIWQNLHNFEKARNCFEKAVLSASDFARTTPDRMGTYRTHLGKCRLKEGEARSAELEFRLALDLLAKSESEEHRAKAKAYDGLGQALKQEDRLPEARSAFMYAVQYFELVGDMRSTSSSLRRLGRVLEQLDEIGAARECYERMEQMYAQGLPAEDKDSARGLLLLGRMYEKEDRHEDALRQYEKACRRHDAHDVLDGESQGHLYQGLSRTLEALERYDESTGWLRKSMALHKRLYGPDHMRSGRDAYYMGVALLKKGEELAGLAHLHEAHRVYTLNLGSDNQKTRDVARKLKG